MHRPWSPLDLRKPTLDLDRCYYFGFLLSMSVFASRPRTFVYSHTLTDTTVSHCNHAWRLRRRRRHLRQPHRIATLHAHLPQGHPVRLTSLSIDVQSWNRRLPRPFAVWSIATSEYWPYAHRSVAERHKATVYREAGRSERLDSVAALSMYSICAARLCRRTTHTSTSAAQVGRCVPASARTHTHTAHTRVQIAVRRARRSRGMCAALTFTHTHTRLP